MAAVTGAILNYDVNTNREDLLDIVANVDPSDTPFKAAIGESTARNQLHEWSTDELDLDKVTAAGLVGGAVTRSDSVNPIRQRNRCQITSVNVTLSHSQMAHDTAGIDDMFEYQMQKDATSQNIVMEQTLLNNQGRTDGDATTAALLRGFPAWLTSNTNRGRGGTDATDTIAAAGDATTGNLRALDEPLVDDMIAQVFQNSNFGVNMLLVPPGKKQIVSDFTGRAQSRQMIDEDKVNARADVYASEFGDLRVVPDRWMRSREIFALDPEYLSVAYLRKNDLFELGNVGAAYTQVLEQEYTLCVKNEKAHGVVADLS